MKECLKAKIAEGKVDAKKGRAALDLLAKLSRQYEGAGFNRLQAEAMAAEEAQLIIGRKAAETRHVLLGQAAAAMRSKELVETSKQLGSLMTDVLERNEASRNRQATVVGTQRALMRRFQHRLGGLIQKHSRDLLGRTRNPTNLANVVKELHGEASGDAAALAMANAVRDAFEDMRLQFNAAGGVIGKLENWGLPHAHNQAAIRKAGFDAWAAEVGPRLAWHKIPNDYTGRPLAEEGEAPSPAVAHRFLREAFDNIAFGRTTESGEKIAREGMALWRRRAQPRVLPFKSTDDWGAYNRKFGSGDPFASIIGHAQRMARDIALAREFGPDPRAGFRARAEMAKAKARELGDVDLARKIEGSAAHGERMLNIISGSQVPAGPFQEAMASLFSTTRHVLTAAFLDRAILSAVSDLNSMRVAAKAVGMNPANVVSRHVKLLADSLSREEAARAGWIADTLADPGAALARFQAEVPPAIFAERLSSLVLRIQGLSHWTDQARIAFQMEMAGLFAENAGKRIADIPEPLRGLLVEKGIGDAEWQAFTGSETLFRSTNGATFASPIYWREATDMDRAAADDLFARLQAIVEEQTEFAVPTRSSWAEAHILGTAPPGSIGYELAKSGLMFKSFPMTVTVNQIRRIMAPPHGRGSVSYALDYAGGAVLLGAVSLQLVELASGNDPLDMTQADFWAAAALRSGTFGLLGDALASTERPGQGLASFVGGPMVGLAQDTASLTFGNLIDAASGQDMNFLREATRYVNRYLPGGDLPFVGIAADRLLIDRLIMAIDGQGVEELAREVARSRKRRSENIFWLPGTPSPSRMPDFSKALGK
ncbi:hypothetical protein [Tabrizicola sp.]|uniref:hypothetical protein n=1 Tax=Tabrizicola sp. TaxID=2005166 RepID=UPI0035B2D47E